MTSRADAQSTDFVPALGLLTGPAVRAREPAERVASACRRNPSRPTKAGQLYRERIDTASPAGAATRQAPKPLRKSWGFTLVELLVTVTVLSILLSLAVPGFRTLLMNDRQWTEQTTFVTSLNLARSEAIKRDIAGGVAVCASTDGATCNGTQWEQGWIVLSSDAHARPNPLQSVGALPPGTTLREASGRLSVIFLSSGMANAQAALTLCDARGATQARYTQLTATGRVASSSSLGQSLHGIALACP